MAVEADGPLLLVFTKQILYNKHDTNVSVMTSLGKQFSHSIISFTHEIIQNDQAPLRCVPLLHFGQAFNKRNAFLLAVTSLPLSITPNNLLRGWRHHFGHTIQKTCHPNSFSTSRGSCDHTGKGVFPSWIHHDKY